MTPQRGRGAVCSGCGYVNDDTWKLGSTVLYANQHSTKIRYFCSVCGQVEERVYRDGELASRSVKPVVSGVRRR